MATRRLQKDGSTMKGLQKTQKIAESTEQVFTEITAKSKWKVLSGGITLLDKRYFDKNSGVFEAYEHDIPKSFRDLVALVESAPAQSVVKKEIKFFKREIVPTAEEQDDENYVQKYDIIDSKNKVVSEVPLTNEDAEKFLALLNT